MKRHLSYILAMILVLSCFTLPASALESLENSTAPVTDESSADTSVDASSADSTAPESSVESSADSSVSESSEDSSAPESSEDSSTPDSSVADSYVISFLAQDEDDFTFVSGVSFTVSNGQTCVSGGTVNVFPEDGAVSFTVTPIDGKEVARVIVNGLVVSADAAGVYNLGSLYSNLTITAFLRDVPGASVSVNISNLSGGDVGGTTNFDASKTYFPGDTISLSINPTITRDADGNMDIASKKCYGISSVTVNGVARDDINVFGMEIELTVSESLTVDIVFARFYAVGMYVRTLDEEGELCNEVGGSFSPTGIHEDAHRGSVAYVLEGTDFRVRINRSNGYKLDRLMYDGEDGDNVTDNMDGSYYTIKDISNNYTLFAFFKPTDDKTYPITIIVTNPECGTASSIGTVQVPEGELHSIEITPNEGYKISSVVKDNVPVTMTGTSLQVEADDAHTIIITFESLTGEESSTDDSSEETSEDSSATEQDSSMITVNDVNQAAIGDEVRLDISQKSFISAEAIIRLNELLAAGKTVYIGVPNSYQWKIPANCALPVPENTAGGLAGFDFKVDVNTGRKSDEMREAIKKMAEINNYKNADNITIEREGSFQLPEAARLLVNVSSYFKAGQNLDWLKYDDLTDRFSAFYSKHDGFLVSVGADCWVEVSMTENNRYGLLVVNIDGTSSITVSWTGSHCSLSVPCTYTEVDGVRTGTFAWKDGKDLIVNVIVRNGYTVKNISSAEFGEQLSYSIINDGTEGGTHTVSFRVNGISIDGSILVETEASDSVDTQKSSNGVEWSTILLIAVIALAMVGGGVVFVIKWRQSDDDDDDDDDDSEFYEDDEDDDDDEDEDEEE